MAFLQCNAFSEILGLSVSFHLLLPQSTQTQIGMQGKAAEDGDLPVLWLLHGMSDDHTIWTRRTALERHVARYNLAVVMPAVHRSYYTDQALGYRYFSYVADELPAICRKLFRISGKREDNHVAGLSMGGYGAFKLALTRPNQYATAASLSGALDLVALAQDRSRSPSRETELTATFGDLSKLGGSGHDLFALLAKVKRSRKAQRPRLYACCGREDFLYQSNQAFLAQATALKYPLEYREGPGAHNWEYWDTEIQNVLRWLPLPENTP